MSQFETLLQTLDDSAKDVRLNLLRHLSRDDTHPLTVKQMVLVALSCAYAKKNRKISDALLQDFSDILTPEDQQAIKGASVVMAMNNIYYRATHLAENDAVKKVPTSLRMNILAQHKIDKNDFEAMCLAVSALNGCGACIASHAHELTNRGATPEAIAHIYRLASLINALDTALGMEE